MGCKLPDSYDYLCAETLAAFTDKEDFFRNKRRPLLLPIEAEDANCKFCNRIKITIEQKMRRLSKRSSNQRVCINNLSWHQKNS